MNAARLLEYARYLLQIERLKLAHIQRQVKRMGKDLERSTLSDSQTPPKGGDNG